MDSGEWNEDRQRLPTCKLPVGPAPVYDRERKRERERGTPGWCTCSEARLVPVTSSSYLANRSSESSKQIDGADLTRSNIHASY